MIDLGEKIWGNEEIERGLRSLPSLIASAAMKVAEKDAEVKQMEHAIKLIEAAETVKKREDKVTATEQKAHGYLATDEQRKQLIILEKEYALLNVQLAELRDCFDSIRKQANIMQEEMRQNGLADAIKRKEEREERYNR